MHASVYRVNAALVALIPRISTSDFWACAHMWYIPVPEPGRWGLEDDRDFGLSLKNIVLQTLSSRLRHRYVWYAFIRFVHH